MANRDEAKTAALAVHRAIGTCVVALALVAGYVGCGGTTTTSPDKGGGDDAGTAADSGTMHRAGRHGKRDCARLRNERRRFRDECRRLRVELRRRGPRRAQHDVPGLHARRRAGRRQRRPGRGRSRHRHRHVEHRHRAPPRTTRSATHRRLGYWSDINSEYGVGPATSGTANHISITTGRADLFRRATRHVRRAHAGTTGPRTTANTIYAVYLPPGTDLYRRPPPAGRTRARRASAATTPSRRTRTTSTRSCRTATGFQTADIELDASHELNEASTDPHPSTGRRTWVRQQPPGVRVLQQFQDELGDACEIFARPSDAAPTSPYTVQRQWSNRSAAAGSQWCLPSSPSPSTTRRSCPRRSSTPSPSTCRRPGCSAPDEQGLQDGPQHVAHVPHRPVQRPGDERALHARRRRPRRADRQD